MKLELVNFKSWENETFEFPESGITLISAFSGKGKSSIMQAIMFALYGVGTKITSYGKKKMKVIMEFDGIKIERSKSPNKLLVNDKFADAEGQELIDKKFSKVFDTIGYIEQKSISNFVTMSPSDKLAFIERFAFQDVDLTEIKKTIKRITTERVNELNTMRGECNMLERMIGDMNDKHNFKEAIPEDLENNINDCKENIENNNKKIKNLEEEYSDAKYNNKSFEKIIEKLNSKRENLKEREKDYIGDDKLEEYKSLVSNYIKYQEMLEYNQTNKRIEKLKNKVVEVDEDEIERLENMISEYNIYQDVLKLNFNEEEYEEKREASQNNFIVCPSCNKNLAITGDKVKVCDKIFDNSKLKKEMKKLDKDYINYKTLKARLKSEDDEYEKLNIEELKIELSKLKNSSEEQKNIKRELKIMKKKLKNVDEIDIPEVNIEFDEVQELINEHTQLKCYIDSANKEIEELNKQYMEGEEIDLEPIKEEKESVEQQNKELNKELEELNKILEKKKIIDTYKEYKKKQKQLEDACIEQGRKCIAIELLKKNIGVAQNIAITNIIETIEVLVQGYIDKFFNDPMVIKLNTFNKTNKPQINIDIFYKDNDTSFSNLSGGEQDRFVLAFTLALSELFNTKLILLDEIIASLDIESTTSIISNIRNNTHGKLVLFVAHQIVNGSFDKVIDL